LGVCEYGNRDR
jgi:hypothetical protein